MNWKLIRIIDSVLGRPLIRLLRRVRQPPHPRELPPQRILLIKFWGIGNIFMILPAIQALRKSFPSATIDFLTLESNRNALDSLEVVDHIATINTGSTFLFLQSWKNSVESLSSNGYDLAIDFEQFARFSALVTWQIGAARTIGFATHGQYRDRLYACPVQYDNHIHITRSFFNLVVNAGVETPFPEKIILPTISQTRKHGQTILANLGISSRIASVVMHIGTSDNFCERRWAPQRYAELAELLRDRYSCQIILTGLPEESHLIRATQMHLKSRDGIFDLSGRLDFAEYFALITAADLVVSADTAAVHLASAVQVPVAGLYGPNTPQLYGPWGTNGLALYAALPCSPCITNFNGKINTCNHPEGKGYCMAALSTDLVFAAIEREYLSPTAPHQLPHPRQ